MIAEDVHLDEVDDGAIDDAVVYVAQRAAQNERERDRGERDAITQPQQSNENAQRVDQAARYNWSDFVVPLRSRT